MYNRSEIERIQCDLLLELGIITTSDIPDRIKVKFRPDDSSVMSAYDIVEEVIP